MQGSSVEVTGDEVALLNLKQRRLLHRTPRMGVGASSVEPAPRGGVDGARYFSTDHVPPPLARVNRRNPGYEHLSVRMERSIDQVRRVRHLHYVSKLHD